MAICPLFLPGTDILSPDIDNQGKHALVSAFPSIMGHGASFLLASYTKLTYYRPQATANITFQAHDDKTAKLWYKHSTATPRCPYHAYVGVRWNWKKSMHMP
jgi:hypothetical protein